MNSKIKFKLILKLYNQAMILWNKKKV